jgi:hypothetical protein
MTSKNDFPLGLSLSGDYFQTSNSVNSFYEPSGLSDDMAVLRNLQDEASFFSGSSNTPSLDESFLFDSPMHGSPMHDDSVC